jgi:hypothetical protein
MLTSGFETGWKNAELSDRLSNVIQTHSEALQL